MKIAIDESGDIGRKFWRGSTPWFVVAAVIVPDTMRGCGLVCNAVSTFKEEFMQGAELHFAHNTHNQHTQFFSYMAEQDFIFVAVAMNKRKLLKRKPYMLASKRVMLKYCIDRLFRELHTMWDNPIVIMDKNSRRIDRALRRHLFQAFGTPDTKDIRHIKNIVFVDSRNEPLVQFADYIAGAVRHHVDKSYDSESYEKYLVDKGKIYYL